MKISLSNKYGLIAVIIGILGCIITLLLLNNFNKDSAILGYFSFPFVFLFVLIMFLVTFLAKIHPSIENLVVLKYDIMPQPTITGFLIGAAIYIGIYFLIGKAIGKIVEKRKKKKQP